MRTTALHCATSHYKRNAPSATDCVQRIQESLQASTVSHAKSKEKRPKCPIHKATIASDPLSSLSATAKSSPIPRRAADHGLRRSFVLAQASQTQRHFRRRILARAPPLSRLIVRVSQEPLLYLICSSAGPTAADASSSSRVETIPAPGRLHLDFDWPGMFDSCFSCIGRCVWVYFQSENW